MDSTDGFVLAMAAVIGVLLLVVGTLWRRMIRGNQDLSIWRFLRREGIRQEDAADFISGRSMVQAELACAICGSQQECRAKLATGRAASPPENCPNARLFDEFGVRVNHIKA